MKTSTHRIREEFDRIALVTGAHESAGDVHYKYLLENLPPRCERALEIGCGAGKFTRLLASRAERVVAVDLSPQMIRLAREQSANDANIEYVLDDVMRLPLASRSYDCVVSIATLHHLPLSDALRKMKDALKPGGVLIVHDLVADDGFVDMIKSAMAYPLSVGLRFWKTGRLRAPREVRQAWDAHAVGDVYLTLNEVKEMCALSLPGARIKRHLLWRYTIVWSKQADSV